MITDLPSAHTRSLDEVRASERRFRQIANAIPQLAWTSDAEGARDWYNDRWYEFTGTRFEDMRGWGWQKVHHPEHLFRAITKLREHLASGAPWEDTVPLRRHDGEYRWFLSRAFPIVDERGRIASWFGTNTDVTGQVQEQEALRAADRRKDEFVAMLSHELRNPLAPIRNAIFLLQRTQPKDPVAAHALRVLSRQTDHLTRLVDDLLEVTRVTHGKIELQCRVSDLTAVVRDAVHDHRRLFEARGVALAAELPARELWAELDGARVAQVMGNMLDNALKFTPAGGRVAVTMREYLTHAEIEVADTGAGIDAALLERLFKPFVQGPTELARTRGGLGLGLVLVKSIVEMHGGSVQASSEGEGRGAQFRVRLPLADRPRDVPAEAEAAHAQPARRVLVVDDNRDAADTLAALVGLLGHRATVAYDGRQALERAREQEHDLVICDIGLPDMDGYTLAARLREAALGGPRLIAMSGFARAEERERALACGFDLHIAKPADVSLIRALFE